jgi:F0F1-type ATP synthase membrane subunit b/b'
LVSIEPVLLLVQLLTFGAAVFLLWKFFWKPLNRFMKNRADRIDYDIRSAGELKTEAENLKRKWNAQMAEAEAAQAAQPAEAKPGKE